MEEVGVELDELNVGLFENEEEIEEEEIEEEEQVSVYEDLLLKNTTSFQCLAQVQISRSSLLRDPLYQFPELCNPNLDSALWEIPLPPKYEDDIGVQRYKDLCKKENILPFRRVIQSLSKETLDLKYYKLNEKAMKTICETLMYNGHVKNFILQENFFTPEIVAYLNPLMEKNTTIRVLDLKQCNLGMFGVEALRQGIIKAKGIWELDLSHNDLSDEGVEILSKVLRKNNSIKKLNLSHNSLSDRALIAFRTVMEENRVLQDINLSWNYFYSPIGMIELMLGMAENPCITSLDLAWNGIGADPKTVKCIIDFLKSDKTSIEHLNVSHNRIPGNLIRQFRRAMKVNKTIVSLNVGFNPISPQDAEFLAGTFFDKRKKFVSKLNLVDVGDTYVTKAFKVKLRRIKMKKCVFKYGGILGDYEVKGPDFKKLLLNRGKFISANMKKKKQRIDIGHVIIMFDQEEIKKSLFTPMLQTKKVKWDEDLLEQIKKEFAKSKKKVDLQLIKDTYLEMYPDTQPPPPKKKTGKGKRKKKGAQEPPPEGTDQPEESAEPGTSQTADARPSQMTDARPSQMPAVRPSQMADARPSQMAGVQTSQTAIKRSSQKSTTGPSATNAETDAPN